MKNIYLILFLFITAICRAQIIDYSEPADVKFRQGEYSEAIGLYTRAINDKQGDNPAYLYYKRSYCYYLLSNYGKAMKDVNTGIKILTENNDLKGNLYWMKGRIYSKRNKKKQSLANYQTSASILVNNSSIYSTIAFKEIQLKRYESALINLNKAIALDSSNAYAYNNRALVHLNLGELEKAEADVDRSIVLNSGNPYAYKHKAMIFIVQNRLNEACECLQKAQNLGYYDFGNEADKKDVQKLWKKHCSE